MKKWILLVFGIVLMVFCTACSNGASSSSEVSSSSSSSSEALVSSSSEAPESSSSSEALVSSSSEAPVSSSSVAPVSTSSVAPASSSSEAPVSSSNWDDGLNWTQERVDTVADTIRTAALDRGWTEETSLDINGNGSWGNPISSTYSSYFKCMESENIEEWLYGLEYSVDRTAEEMYFHVYVEDCGSYWEIYLIFSYDMRF